jgi:type II secretory pathway pseudopilin PulG
MRVSRSLSPQLALRLLRHPTPLKQRGNQFHTFCKSGRGRSESGLTLIECLVAIIIVALTILAITPPILLATGTRVQSRRAEQSNQIAQAEIDRVRSLMERGVTDINLLPPNVGAIQVGAFSTFAAANVPPSTTNSSSSPLQSPSACGLDNTNRYPPIPPVPPATASAPLPANNLVKVDVDGDCTPEYVMQVFRNQGLTATGNLTPSTFDIGVRVYTYFPGQTLPTLNTTRSSLVSSINTRENQIQGGVNRRSPLAVLYSTLSRNDQSSSLEQICRQARARGASGGGTCTF